jgi:hypothetical protein
VDAVQAEVEPATAPIGSFSPVMLVYGGPDLVGLAWVVGAARSLNAPAARSLERLTDADLRSAMVRYGTCSALTTSSSSTASTFTPYPTPTAAPT